MINSQTKKPLTVGELKKLLDLVPDHFEVRTSHYNVASSYQYDAEVRSLRSAKVNGHEVVVLDMCDLVELPYGGSWLFGDLL